VTPRLRVLTALSFYHPYWTGLTTIAQAIAEGLAARGHQVTVVTTQHEPELPRRERVNGVDVVRVPVVARVSRAVLAPALVPTVARHLAGHDLLQVHTPMPEAWPLAALARRRGTPFVMTHQGDVVMPAGLVNRVIERAFTATLARAGRLAQRVTTLSGDYAAHSPLLSPLGDKVTAIHPPVLMPGPDHEEAARWRRSLGLEDRPVVGFAGRFVEEKGFDRLLEAIPALVEREPRVHLLYAGQPMPYERFYQRCRPLLDRHVDRVTELGLLTDRRRLAAFYAMCDVVAVPSRTDCWAAVQVEAMRCGTPVVTSDIPGAREAVRLGGMGRLVPSGDVPALAAALADTLAAPRDGHGGERPFDPERAIDAYEALFGGLA
jgi:glycosyltransferase involved in cell wall biosynthesis